jgi:glycine/serine hydroxymethyltransferase
MRRIAALIDQALSGLDADGLAAVRREVEALATEFPLYRVARVGARP